MAPEALRDFANRLRNTRCVVGLHHGDKRVSSLTAARTSATTSRRDFPTPTTVRSPPCQDSAVMGLSVALCSIAVASVALAAMLSQTEDYEVVRFGRAG